MKDLLTPEILEYFCRILLAALCGAAIGFERESRMKIAGIRTHLIVALAAALMMIVSKYGFNDILSMPGIDLDPSRIAAGTITAIGFLGAGVIFVRQHNISGITTAAGIWATVGIGIAAGAGMYFLSVSVSLLIILFQILLHKKLKLVKEPLSGLIVLKAEDAEHAKQLIDTVTAIQHIEVTGFRINRLESGGLELRLHIKCPKLYEASDTIQLLRDIPNVQSVEI